MPEPIHFSRIDNAKFALDLLRLPEEKRTFEFVVKIFTDLCDGFEGCEITEGIRREAIDFRQKKADAGKKGGLAKASSAKQNQAVSSSAKQCLPLPSQSINQSINQSDNHSLKQSRFKKPTVQEIEEYCRERKNKIDAQTFFDHYEAKGWFIGKNKMKCWKSAVRTWESKRKKEEPKSIYEMLN